MKVLIIGNGFDLYHGLPTRYSDFLFLALNWDTFYKTYIQHLNDTQKSSQVHIRLNKGCLTKESLIDFALRCKFNRDLMEFLDQHITSNIWIQYFMKFKFEGNKWVDFENEIDNALQLVETCFNLLNRALKNDGVNNIKTEEIDQPSNSYFGINISSENNTKVKTTKVYLDEFYMHQIEFLLNEINYACNFSQLIKLYKSPNNKHLSEQSIIKAKNDLLKKLKSELNVMIECLRIYLVEFVESINFELFSQQIKHLDDIYLLNFNYTNTYNKIYKNKLIDYHSIHGNCQKDGLVLGISDDSFKDNLEYIYFVKYFQRIQKRTGNYYKKWIEDEYFETFIMGHSLSITDKGVLDDFFLNDKVNKITIYYHNQLSYEEMIINLVKSYGKEYMIEQTQIGRIVFEKLGMPINKYD